MKKSFRDSAPVWALFSIFVIYFAVLAWLILGDRLFKMLMHIEAVASSVPLTVLASLLAPSVWISIATEAISALMLRFWTLLPFLS